MGLEWHAEGLRLSVFSDDKITIGHDDWKSISGLDEPEAEQRAAGRHTIRGPFADGQLSLSTNVSRIDCVLAPKPIDDIPEGYYPSVGHWPEIAEQFRAATNDWLSSLKFPVVRVAFAATLLSPQEDRATAYASLMSQLKSVRVDLDRVRDLTFRVNWRADSTIMNSLILNRLTTWSVVQISVKMLAGMGDTVVMEETPTSQFARLEIDNNTDVEHKSPFDQSLINPIYEELYELALDNAANGEVL